MPLYDYKCNICGTEFEVSHGMTETPRVRCPECRKKAHKIIVGFPHTRLDWKAYDRNDSGSSRLVLNSTSRAKPKPYDEHAGKRL